MLSIQKNCLGPYRINTRRTHQGLSPCRIRSHKVSTRDRQPRTRTISDAAQMHGIKSFLIMTKNSPSTLTVCPALPDQAASTNQPRLGLLGTQFAGEGARSCQRNLGQVSEARTLPLLPAYPSCPRQRGQLPHRHLAVAQRPTEYSHYPNHGSKSHDPPTQRCAALTRGP